MPGRHRCTAIQPLPASSESLIALLPHGGEARFVTQVIHLCNKHIAAYGQFPVTNPMIAAHFPRLQIVQGGLLLEAAAQATAIYGLYQAQSNRCRVVLEGIQQVVFARYLRPSSQFLVEASYLGAHHGLSRFQITLAEARTNKLIMRGMLSGTIRKR